MLWRHVYHCEAQTCSSCQGELLRYAYCMRNLEWLTRANKWEQEVRSREKWTALSASMDCMLRARRCKCFEGYHLESNWTYNKRQGSPWYLSRGYERYRGWSSLNQWSMGLNWRIPLRDLNDKRRKPRGWVTSPV